MPSIYMVAVEKIKHLIKHHVHFVQVIKVAALRPAYYKWQTTVTNKIKLLLVLQDFFL